MCRVWKVVGAVRMARCREPLWSTHVPQGASKQKHGIPTRPPQVLSDGCRARVCSVLLGRCPRIAPAGARRPLLHPRSRFDQLASTARRIRPGTPPAVAVRHSAVRTAGARPLSCRRPRWAGSCARTCRGWSGSSTGSWSTRARLGGVQGSGFPWRSALPPVRSTGGGASARLGWHVHGSPGDLQVQRTKRLKASPWRHHTARITRETCLARASYAASIP